MTSKKDIHIKLYSGEKDIRRFSIKPDSTFEDFKKIVEEKGSFESIQYLDEENDWITVTSELEWKNAILQVLVCGEEKRVLKIKVVLKEKKEEKKEEEKKKEEKDETNPTFRPEFPFPELFPGMKKYMSQLHPLVEQYGGWENVIKMVMQNPSMLGKMGRGFGGGGFGNQCFQTPQQQKKEDVKPEEKYKSQLRTLKEMGFAYVADEKLLEYLVKYNGDVSYCVQDIVKN